MTAPFAGVKTVLLIRCLPTRSRSKKLLQARPYLQLTYKISLIRHNHTDDVVSSFLCYDSLTDANNICLDESEDLLRDFVGSTAAESILLFPGQLPPQPPRLPPPKNSYVCFKPGCHGRRFASLGNLNRHQREKHGRSKRYYCKTCGKSFTRSTARNIHLEKGRCDMPEQDIDETLDEHHDNLLFEQFHLKFRRCRCRCRLNPHNAT